MISYFYFLLQLLYLVDIQKGKAVPDTVPYNCITIVHLVWCDAMWYTENNRKQIKKKIPVTTWSVWMSLLRAAVAAGSWSAEK